MTMTGRCQCGAINYRAEGEPLHHALCHCGDCRKSAGAPMVGWIAFKTEQLTVDGTPVTYASSKSGRRQFCGTCGTGLFYINEEALPGLVDVQSSTLDDPNSAVPGAHIQTAERLDWMTKLDEIPAFERYPPM